MEWLKLGLWLVDLLRSAVRYFEGATQRQAGRDAERAETLEANAERRKIAEAAREQADKDHATKDDDGAFDNSFRRD